MQNSGSFDRFTERARKVLTMAQEEARRFNHDCIGTEHLLLGLVREGEGVAAKVLSNLGIELTTVRGAVESVIGPGEHGTMAQIGLTPAGTRVIELGVEEARRLALPLQAKDFLKSIYRKNRRIGTVAVRISWLVPFCVSFHRG